MRLRRAHSPAGRSLDERLVALREASGLARGRLDDELVDRAEAVVAQAGARLGLGVEATVVALAGPTGAGKSTLFNALAGEELTRASHLRPTTATATAAVWGDVGDELLDWLEVPTRHRREGEPEGLVLLDLPDFDSVERAHRAESERVVALADLTIWVVDPQKYADGVLHERYLRPLAEHAGAMLVVLNHADRLDEAARRECVTDLQRLLADDGLAQLTVVAVSALTGLGLEELRSQLQRRVEAREAAVTRLEADVAVVTGGFGPSCEGRATGLGDGDRATLARALGIAAGVPVVVQATARSHRRRGALATGWPYLRWLRRARPDPLRRLGLGRADGDGRSSLAPATRVQDAQVDMAVRSIGTRAGQGLAQPWPTLVRGAALREREQLPAALERAVAQAELPTREPFWWRGVNLLQWLLVAVALVGGLWLLALALLAYLQLDQVIPTPDVEGIPLPTSMLLGGLVLGLLLALLCGAANRFGAHRRARRAERSLAHRIAVVGESHVLAPLEAELSARRELCEAVARAAPEGHCAR